MLQRSGLTNNWQKIEYLLRYRNENFKSQLLRQSVIKMPGQATLRFIWSNNGMRSGISGANLKPFESSSTNGGGVVTPSNIIKAIAFAGAFSLGSYFGATILEYENTRNMMLERARQAKRLRIFRKPKDVGYWKNIRLDIKRSWDKLKPGEKVFVPICAINVLVFAAWRIPSFKNVMIKYFCSNSVARVVCWPMFLSTFSHYSGLHLFANMYVLHGFANAAVLGLGKEQFLGVYLTAGVIASLTSILYKIATTQHSLSLGASGAIMAILAYVCTQYPETQLSILFLPGITFPAGTAIKFVMGLDLAGCIMGWKFFDHAAHLGGALFGIFWAYYGTELWKKRLPFLLRYHDWRKSSTN